MVNFFVLDDAGDYELAFEIDEYGEETYRLVDEKDSSNLDIKKFKKFATFLHVEDFFKNRLCICKITGYPEIVLNFIMDYHPAAKLLMLMDFQTLPLKDDLIVFKVKNDLFVQPHKYSNIRKGRYICFNITTESVNDETMQILESPKYFLTTTDLKNIKISPGNSWRILLNYEETETDLRTAEIIQKYKFQKFKIRETGKSYYISEEFEDISEVITKENYFESKILTLLEVIKSVLNLPYNFDEPFSGWFFTVLPFISFVNGLSAINSTSISGRIVHLSQSSGHGKTRICFELLKFFGRGVYCVYRGNSNNGFPKTTPWFKALFEAFDNCKDDLDSTILCAKFILHSVKSFGTIDEDKIKIFKGELPKSANEIPFNLRADEELNTQAEKEEQLKRLIAEISSCCGDLIFPFVFDECHEMLKTPINRPYAINLYRTMRRVLFLLKKTKIVAIFLGTKSSLSDFILNHRRDPSIREIVGDAKNWVDVPCYVFTQNVDAMFTEPCLITYNNCSLIKNIGGAHISHPKGLKEVARNFGRPLWSQYEFDYAFQLALDKLKTDGKLFELACLILRTGSQVVPQDELAHKLVLSCMATLLNVDLDGSRCWVEYIPEPILSNAARIALTDIGNLERGVNEYLRRLQIGSFHDSGSSGEFVARIVLLRAMDLSLLKQRKDGQKLLKWKDIKIFTVKELFGDDLITSLQIGDEFLTKSRKIFEMRESSTHEFYKSPELITEQVASASVSKDVNIDPKEAIHKNPKLFHADTEFLSPFIGTSTVREYLMFLADLEDDEDENDETSLKKLLGVSDETMNGFVCFSQFIQMENPLHVNQPYLLHFFTRSCAMILPKGAQGADLIIPVLRTDNRMSCIVIQVKNYATSTFPYKSAETMSKLSSSYLNFLNLDAMANFERVSKDDFVRVVIQFDCTLKSKVDAENVVFVPIPSSTAHQKSSQRCHAIWLRGLDCFEGLFFHKNEIVKSLSIIINGQRDFLSGIEYPLIKLPTLLQTTQEGARFLANSARTLVNYENVVVQDCKLRDSSTSGKALFKRYLEGLEKFFIPRFAVDYNQNRTLTTFDKDLSLLKHQIPMTFENAPIEIKRETVGIMNDIENSNTYGAPKTLIPVNDPIDVDIEQVDEDVNELVDEFETIKPKRRKI